MVTVAKSGIAYNAETSETSTTNSFRGLSTDAKPTKVPENSTFLELDTGVGYYFSGGEWKVFAADKPEGMSISAALIG